MLIDIYSSSDGDLIKGGFSCMLLAHQTVVGIRTNVDEISWGRVCMCQPTTIIVCV